MLVKFAWVWDRWKLLMITTIFKPALGKNQISWNVQGSTPKRGNALNLKFFMINFP